MRISQQGFVLVAVLTTLAVLASIAMLLSASGSNDSALQAKHREVAELRFVAEAGMAHAKWQLRQNGTCSTYIDLPATPFGSHSYSATVTPTSGSPVTLATVGVFADGATRTLTDTNVVAYGGANSMVLQPGAAGTDTYIRDGAYGDKNFGATGILGLNNQTAEEASLLAFDLSSLPAGVRIESAMLELWLEGGNALGNGVVDVHRLTQAWVEGVEDDSVPAPGAGATYESYDGQTGWLTQGGDYASPPIDTVTIAALVPAWYQWDLTSTVQDWYSGALPNDGVIVRASAGNVDKIWFTSSDGSAGRRPRISVTYACECGVPCDAVTSSNEPYAHWKLDETSGLTAVDSVGGHDGDLQNGPVWNINGKLDGALDFDGSNDHIEVPHDSTLQFGSAFTVTAWVKNESPSISGSYRIISKESSGANDNFWISMQSGTLWAGVGGDAASPGTSLIPNIWYHIAVSFDDAADKLRIYIDGIKVLEYSTTATITPNTDPLIIGGNWEAGKYWDGLLDDVRIYGSVLDDSQIAELADTGGSGTYLDQFNAVSYDGNDGSLNWSNNWQELGESNGPGSGRVLVVSSSSRCSGSGCLRIGGDEVNLSGRGVSREANLDGATSAELTFTIADSGSEGSVLVEVSADGGANWTTLQTFSMGSSIPATPTQQTFDISAYTSANTQIRFVGSGSTDDAAYLYIDDVRIEKEGSAPESGPACAADFVPDIKDDEFSTSSLGISDPWGITFLPPGTTFNGVIAPADGAWLLVDGSNRDFIMTDMTGTQLASRSIPVSEPRGVALVTSGTWDGHLAIANPADERVYLLGMNAAVQGSISTTSITEHPVGVAFIANSATGTYDGHIAISSDKNNSGGSVPGIYIVDQSGSVKKSIDISGFTTEPWGVAHVPGKDRFLVAEKSGDVYIVDFDGNLLDQYALSTFGASEPQSIAINTLTSSHAVLDKSSNKVVSLSSSTCGGGGGVCDGTFRDEFTTVSYGNNDGTLTWVGDWLEINESNGPTSGDEKVDDNDSDFHLQVRDNDGGGEGVQREADLSASTSATFSIEYRRDGFDNSNDYVTVDVSDNGGSSWFELDRISGPGTDSSYVSTSYDISAHIASDTRVRFLTSPNHGSGDELYIDNVEIAVSGCAN